MLTLVIHTPDYMARHGARSFEAVLQTGKGVGYAISNADVKRLSTGCKVVLLVQDGKSKRRAEGQLVSLVPTGETTAQGIKRYDVLIAGLKPVPYSYERLNRFGIAVI